jgi:hypothetical protein
VTRVAIAFACAPLSALALVAAFALASASASGCSGDETARPGAASPSARVASPAIPRPPPPEPLVVEAPDAWVPQWSSEDASVRAPAPARPLPEPAFGATEPAKPGDPHAFRLAAALRAMRGTRSGAKVLKTMSVIPAVIEAKAKTGVDPFADGEWLLVYGSKVELPGPNANVVKHGRSDGEVTKTIADAGLDAWDAGTSTNAFRADIYGVCDVLVRPQPGVVALVPGDRARDLTAALASKSLDPGVKPGELARVFVAEPAKVARFLPAEIVRASVTVKAASDGGLELGAEADCPDAATCKTTATALDELARRQNSLMVRIVTKNVLANLAVRADGAKLKATLHASPEQVDAALALTRSFLGLPAEDPSDPTPSPSAGAGGPSPRDRQGP